jgi:hypothetical protein
MHGGLFSFKVDTTEDHARDDFRGLSLTPGIFTKLFLCIGNDNDFGVRIGGAT